MREVLDTQGVDMVMQIGDQIYTDEPKPWFGKSNTYWDRALAAQGRGDTAAVVEEFRNCHRKFWSAPEWRAVAANCPQYMIWDDHDIVNGWGSEDVHATLRHQAAFAAARQVYHEYQHSHNPITQPNTFYYGFDIGAAAFMVLDLRGNRQAWNNQLLGASQVQWVDQFLTQRPHATVLFLISSVPMFHLSPRWAALPKLLGLNVSDVTDQWSSPPNRGDRIAILKRLYQWLDEVPGRRVVILGGDVHLGTFGKAVYTGGQSARQLIQATTSPISNKPADLLDRFVRRVSGRFSLNLENGLGLDVNLSHRFTQRNFLIVNMEFPAGSSVPSIVLEFHTENSAAPQYFAV